ncbi:erythromycin esterase family protein [Frateuria sp. GZRR35]|uniref:erythromycin esterase family protein n=1 Tax=Frateuria sp. GZRR35 TaxID=3351536 RepID=UPI003EDCAA1C
MRVSLALLCFIVATASWAHAAPAAAPLDPVIHALCSKDVVLLGEDANHAAATTLQVKSRLVERLVARCGFRGVVFESQFYDMLAAQRHLAAGSGTRQQLTDAIGALWSRYPSFAPLADWLFKETRAGRIYVAGMDPQVGGITAYYTQQRLPGVLAGVLAGGRRRTCEQVIGRHDRWTYDDTHPFDSRALDQLRGCLRDIRAGLDARPAGVSPDVRAMADSYTDYLAFADGDPGGLRDRAMYANLKRIRASWPAGTRVIVWCASVHAARSLEGARPGVRPFGSYVHASLGDHAAAVGFSALSGSYGQVGGRGPAHTLVPAAPGSLEAVAYAHAERAPLRFLDRGQLRALGKVSGRALVYGTPYTLDWSKVLDGVIVLREESAAVARP